MPYDQNDGRTPRPIHRSPIFWIGVVLVLAAMLTYVFTMDLATRPGARPEAAGGQHGALTTVDH